MGNIARKRFHGWRFDERNPRDIELAEWIQNDIEQGRVNIGEICKDLLYAYYVYVRGKGGYVGSGSVFLNMFRETLENSLQDMLAGLKLTAPRLEERTEPEKKEAPKPKNADRARSLFKLTADKTNWNK